MTGFLNALREHMTRTARLPENAIVGAWQVPGRRGAIVWQFEWDGTFRAGDVRGTYSLPDRAHLELRRGGECVVWPVDVTENTLTLSITTGGRTVTRILHRVRL